MQVLYDESLEQPPAADRLRAMINALANGLEIDASLRAEIIDALKRHEIRRANDERRRKKGRDIERPIWFAAAIAKELIGRHRANPKAAFIAAAKSAWWQQGIDPASTTDAVFDRVERAYQKLNASKDGYINLSDGSKFKVAFISEAWLEDAAARLVGRADIGSGAALDGSAHGIIVELTDPIE